MIRDLGLLSREAGTAPGGGGLSRALVPLLALCSGVTVANIYLSQPLLTLIAADLGVAKPTAGFVATAAQLGYALGLVLLIPLGDVVRRRRLIGLLIGGAALALAGAGLAPTLPVLLAASLVASTLTVVPQLLLPLAAQLAGDARRGRVLAAVMTGVVIGIFLSRVVYGQLGELLDWRAAYLTAAVLTAAVGAATVAVLPVERRQPARYGELMASLPRLLREEPALRQACLFQATAFGTFIAFWTTLVFPLTAPPYGYSVGIAALIGLVGLTAGVASPPIGQLIDRYGPFRVIGGGLALAAAGAAAFTFTQYTLAAVIVGVAALATGMQASQIANQTRLFSRRPEARNRMNTIYMTGNFAAGTVSAGLASSLYGQFGWPGVAAFGTATSLLGLLAWLALALNRRHAGRVALAAQPGKGG